jgi:uncharacterized protein (TIGR00369 family)
MIRTALDDLPRPPSAKLLGWHLIDARPEDGWVRIGFEGSHAFCNPAGFIQGGILSAMLDDTMGPAVFVKSQGRFYTATISITVNFIAPAEPGALVAEAQVIQLGGTVAFMQGQISRADGKLIATATANARLLDSGRALAPRAIHAGA